MAVGSIGRDVIQDIALKLHRGVRASPFNIQRAGIAIKIRIKAKKIKTMISEYKLCSGWK